ncbi:MAG: hypothetical protein WED04_10380 [Promethearchaeati archaeon SRVP18_Atabeyarchaeia-1]
MGFAVVFYTLYFENVLTLDKFLFSFAVLTGGTAYELCRVRRGYLRALKKLSEMIEAVKEGKELPKLEEMIK